MLLYVIIFIKRKMKMKTNNNQYSPLTQSQSQQVQEVPRTTLPRQAQVRVAIQPGAVRIRNGIQEAVTHRKILIPAEPSMNRTILNNDSEQHIASDEKRIITALAEPINQTENTIQNAVVQPIIMSQTDNAILVPVTILNTEPPLLSTENIIVIPMSERNCYTGKK
jgi:hypothetical protein